MIDIVFDPAAQSSLRMAKVLELNKERKDNRAGSKDCLSQGPVLCFDLLLSSGDISEEIPGEKREKTLTRIWGDADKARKTIKICQQNLDRVEEAIRQGEKIRIWYSDNPDALCGFFWLTAMLEKAPTDQISYVTLPVWEERTDGTLVHWSGWREVEPTRMFDYMDQEKELRIPVRIHSSIRWRKLMRENQSLRAVVNGELISVPEDFYDPFILRALLTSPSLEEALSRVVDKLKVREEWLIERAQTLKSGPLWKRSGGR